MMPPPVHVCAGLTNTETQRVVCKCKIYEVIRYAAASDVDSNFPSYPVPLSLEQFRSKRNQFICRWYR